MKAVEAPDIERYTQPQSVWAALETGHVRLLKMSWLIRWARDGQILARRQQLPEEAFMPVKELRDIFQGRDEAARADKERAYVLREDTVLPIISISYCWSSSQHPDPDGQQLRTVANMLEDMRREYEVLFSDMGIFWDWASLFQKDPMLFEPRETPEAKPEGAEREAFIAELKAGRSFYGGAAYEKSRSKEGTAAFHFALHETMDLWYSHQGTTVYMLTELPERCARAHGYHDSGWTTYERCCAEQIKKDYWGCVYVPGGKWNQIHAHWDLVQDISEHVLERSARARHWPTGPEDFDELIQSKKFTNGSDTDAVRELFRKMSTKQLGGIKDLNFDDFECAPALDDAKRLGRCLNLCVNLTRLNVSRSGWSDETFLTMWSTLGHGALPALRDLALGGNNLSDASIVPVVRWLPQSKLEFLNFGYEENQHGDASALALSEVLPLCSSLEKIAIHANNIGELGAKAIASVIHKSKLRYAVLDTPHYWELPLHQLRGHSLRSSDAADFPSCADFSGKGIGPISAMVIAACIEGNTHLTSLDLSSCQICGIGPDGGPSVCGKRFGRDEADWVHTHQQAYTSLGVDALATALPRSSLTRLDLRLNQLTDATKSSLQDAVAAAGSHLELLL